jgi:hypothetical protein
MKIPNLSKKRFPRYPCQTPPNKSKQLHINPPKTNFPSPATSPLIPFRVVSSNSRITFATRIFRTLLSAFAKASPTVGLHCSGVVIRLSRLLYVSINVSQSVANVVPKSGSKGSEGVSKFWKS